ncbi:MAG: hypothetical protein KatS3mg008_1547 [Acidimicrobiales bacterium]|nr:MAG: hypothetical protein KatS3mg008_1547 [Acidimicrobiales bacterium]
MTGRSEREWCHESIRRVYEYLDGELSDDLRREIEAHLGDCPPCKDAFSFEEQLRYVIASRCKEVPSERLVVEIRNHAFTFLLAWRAQKDPFS